MFYNNKEEDQLFKTEFMMVQSCERRQNEMIYKNVSRKYINFDLKDNIQMANLARTLKPFGFLENLHHKCIGSNNPFFRIWAETALAKKGVAHLRKLYQEQSDKFFDIHFEGSDSTTGHLRKCKLVVSETVSQKVVSLKKDNFFADEINAIRSQLTMKENDLSEEQKLADEFAPEQTPLEDNLIGSSVS